MAVNHKDLSLQSHEESGLFGSRNEQLLRKGHAVEAQLNAQVASGHHQGLRLGDDALNVGQGLTSCNSCAP